MRWMFVVCLAVLTSTLGACGDDAAGLGGGAEATTTDDTSTGPEDTGEPEADASGDADGVCMVDADCDDADPCTADVCEEGVCGVSGAVASNACRPVIDVEFPPRAATLQSGAPAVDVRGTVSSAAGAITGLTINGEEVAVGEDGRFAHEVTAQVGGNTLVLETVDDNELSRRRVQSFLWSPEYLDPAAPPEGVVEDGSVVYIDQQSLDDGDASLPANDIATVLGLAVGTTDIGAFIDPTVPLATAAGYDVFVTGLAFGSSSVQLEAIDGGLLMTTTLSDVQGDLWLEGLISSTGGFAIDSIEAAARLYLDVNAENKIAVAVLTPETTVSNLDLWTDNGFTNFLLAIIEPFIIGGVIADIEATLTDQLTSLMGPAIELALGALAPNSTLSFDRLDAEEDPISVRLYSDFEDLDFHDGVFPPEPSPPQGGALMLRSGGFAQVSQTPYENLGVPVRAGCGRGAAGLTAPREGAVEIVFSDDLLNQLLHGAWRGGLFEFEMPTELVGGGDTSAETIEVTVSGMLAPTTADCGADGELRMHLGDLRLDGSVSFGGEQISFVAFSSLAAGIELVPTEAGVEIMVGDVQWVETELQVSEGEGVVSESQLVEALEGQLVDGVLGALGREGLAQIGLPQLDLSGLLGLPLGTAAIAVSAEQAVRQPGSTVIVGHL